MEVVISLTIGVLIFAVAVVIYSKFIVRNATLETLPDLPDEQLLFEEDRVRVTQVGAQRPVVFLSCKLRVTNHRIIAAQKGLLSSQHMLRLVAWYREPDGEGTDLGQSLRSACVVSSTPRNQITVVQDGDDEVLTIPLGCGLLTQGQTMLVHSKRLPKLTAALDQE
jgi:hypothetical protein